MAITLNLATEQEQELEEIAHASGLSVEGYLLTLVEAILHPQLPEAKWRRFGAIQRRRNASSTTEPRAFTEEAARRMRADLLAAKEQAVDAVTRMNLLRQITTQQQQMIAQKELQALTLARDGEPDKARRCFQESYVYGENLRHTRPLLEEATQTAENLLTVFKQAEAKAQARASQAQSAALAAIQSDYAKATLTEPQMQKRIAETATEEQWLAQFAVWLQSVTEPEEVVA